MSIFGISFSSVNLFKLDIPTEEIIKLGIASNKKNVETNTKIKFNFISTGDNDNGDCERSAYSFKVTVKYLNNY